MFEEDISEDIDILTADESEEIQDSEYFPFDPGENLIVRLNIWKRIFKDLKIWQTMMILTLSKSLCPCILCINVHAQALGTIQPYEGGNKEWWIECPLGVLKLAMTIYPLKDIPVTCKVIQT